MYIVPLAFFSCGIDARFVWKTIFNCGDSTTIAAPDHSVKRVRVCSEGSTVNCVESKTQIPLDNLRTGNTMQTSVEKCDLDCVTQNWNGKVEFLELLTHSCKPRYPLYHACRNVPGLHFLDNWCVWTYIDPRPVMIQYLMLAPSPPCGGGWFTCDTMCIPAHWVCDGTQDCFDESDEFSCAKCPDSRPLKCTGTSKCIKETMRCDGVRDCSDGMDEAICDLCDYKDSKRVCLPSCTALKDEGACASSKDGRYGSHFWDEPCVWCCGDKCDVNGNMCEPLKYLRGSATWGRKGHHSKDNTCPVDCKWDKWNDWGLCSLPCGNGTQSRVRKKQAIAERGGSCPGKSTETRPCNTHGCLVDCKWYMWNDWGLCSLSCGNGTQSRFRKKQSVALYNGSCPGKSTETRPCNTHECPVHCEWFEWSVWDHNCDDCEYRVEYRAMKVLPKFQGTPCIGNSIDLDPCGSMCSPKAELAGEKLHEVPTQELLDERKRKCHLECKSQCTMEKLCSDIRPRRGKIWHDPAWARKWFGTVFNKFSSEVAMTDSFVYPALSTAEARALTSYLWLFPVCENSSDCDLGRLYQKTNITHVLDNFYHWYLSEAEIDGKSRLGLGRSKVPIGGKRMRQADMKSRKKCTRRCKIWCFEACECNWSWEFPYFNDVDFGWRHNRPMRYRWIRSEKHVKPPRGTWKCVSSNNVALRVPWDDPFWSMDIYSPSVKKEEQRKFAASGSLSFLPVEFRLSCQHVRDIYVKAICGENAVNCRLNCILAPAAVIAYMHQNSMLHAQYMKSSSKRKKLVETLRDGVHTKCRRTCAEAHVPDFERDYPTA